MGRFRAVIFDMDGVLADSEPLYHQGLNEALKDFGIEISEAEHNEMLGMTVEATWNAINEKHAPPASFDECVAHYDRAMVRLLSQPREPLPGARELLTALRRLGVPCAVASSSWPNWVAALLGSIGLAEFFAATVSSTAVANGKPAPDIFLYAAERLRAKPEECIAVEDSPTGVAAAKAAGTFVIQLRAASTACRPLPQADLVLDSLSQFPLSLLE